MGQYYILVNADKREALHPHKFGNGLKLMEWSYDGNVLVNALLNLMQTEWKGDRVYVVGDYADLDDTNEVWYSTLEKLTEEFGIHDGLYEEYPDSNSLYTYATANFRFLSPEEVKTDRTAARYVYNHETWEVLVLKNSPVFHEEKNVKWRIAPLPLLLAMGNGRGGGDYRGNSEEMVGEWCEHSKALEVTTKQRTNHKAFTEIRPDFWEEW